jgi:predicted pyridoxine 5'-phosphate oxidase superfamily flavin-nucleotide-binding protein
VSSVYHSGEIAVQALAGVQQAAAQNGRSIRSALPKVAADFLGNQELIIVASIGEHSKVWASIVTGKPGFIKIEDEKTIRIDAEAVQGDPLIHNLQINGEAGILAIEFSTRRRMRVNGTAAIHSGSIYITVEQVYANCPKYIQARQLASESSATRQTAEVRGGTFLSEEQKRWIEGADTFFIASASAANKADASHRGGSPGFVRVTGDKTLIFPDYFGNSMFNTLGNIYDNPHAGLLFVDFHKGHTLQLTGKATIIWDEKEIVAFAGAERLVAFEVEEIIQVMNATHMQWGFLSYSPFNPR